MTESPDRAEEIRYYKALESNKRLAGEVQDNSDTGQAAMKMKVLSKVLSQKEVNQSELMKQLIELSQIGESKFYHDLFLKKYDKIIALEKGEISNLSNSVEKFGWEQAFLGWFIASYLIMSVCTAFNFIWVSFGNGTMLDWPWCNA